MNIAFLGGLVGQNDTHEADPTEEYVTRDPLQFADACRSIGRELFARGHSLVVANDEEGTSDRYAVEGAVSYLEGGLQPEFARVFMVQPRSSKTRLFPQWSKSYPSVFLPDYWGLDQPEYLKLGIIRKSDAVIIVGGAYKSRFAGIAGAVSGKRVVPVGSFAGAGEALRREFFDNAALLGSVAPDPATLQALANEWSEDMTEIVLDALSIGRNQKIRIFVIHGRSNDYQQIEGVLTELARKANLALEVDVMKDEAYFGFLPDQYERMARMADGAIAVVTPDDKGGLKSANGLAERARQNVILEIGWFWARLGVSRIAVLQKSGSNIEIPSDISGIKVAEYDRPEEASPVLEAFLRMLAESRAR